MIDLQRVSDYRENNRIEAKKSLGGLPKSIWETYSAFANTLGGIILLGVREEKDKSLRPVCLPNPEQLVDEFWRIINDPSKISVNILTRQHVEIVGTGDSRFIAITVPRAARYDRPIYIGTDPYLGSYRRNGEGDYRCGMEEIKSMLRDGGKSAKDMRPILGQTLRSLDKSSVESYRRAVLKNRPHTPLANVEERDFLEKVGVIVKDNKDVFRPTGAGLLMLGKYKNIKEEYPYYRVSFDEGKTRRKSLNDTRVGGNLFCFFTRVFDEFSCILEENGRDAKAAATETLTNCLVNADYYARSGVYVTYKRAELVFSNPGGFRLEVDNAKSGGVSDPRNAGLLRLFQQIGVGNGTGSGIPSIYALWGKEGRGIPVIRESFHPERVSVTLPFSLGNGKKNALKSKAGKKRVDEEEKRAIIEWITDNIQATIADICNALRLSSTDAKTLLLQLVDEGILKKEENVYTLKS